MTSLLDGITDGSIIKIFVLLVFLGGFLLWNTLSEMKQLPSPLYGGDYYYQQGQVYHYLRGGAPLESSSLEGAPPSYSPLYAWIVGYLSGVFGLDAFEGMKLFAFLFYFLSMGLWYFVLNQILGSKKAVLGTLLINFLAWHPIFKYTEFGYAVVLPLFIWVLHRALKEERWWVAVGFMLGMLAYTHGVIAIGAAIISHYLLIKKNSQMIVYLVMGGLVVVPLLLVYLDIGLEKKFPRYKMDFPDFSRLDVWAWFLGYFMERLFSLNSWVLLILLYFGFKVTEFREWLIGAFIAVFSFIVTEPLLGMNFFPTYMTQLVFFPIFVITLLSFSKEERTWVYLGLIILVFSLNYLQWENKLSDRFFEISRQPLSPEYASLQAYLLENTSVSDVVLTNKELGFALNALSGIKLVTGRWAHNTNSPYVDMPLRDVHAAVMLYGNNLSGRLNLIRQYGVSYVFVHVAWPTLEFLELKIPKNKYEAAQVLYDPLFTTNPHYKHILQENGIKSFDVEMWLDPSIRTPQIKTFYSTVVSWENYQPVGYGLWDSELDQYLEPVWFYQQDNVTVAVLYRIRG